MVDETTLSLAIVAGYLVVALAIGLLAYRLTDRNAEDYYLASRSMGTVVLLFTTFATLLSAFTFFGGPNLAYSAGPEWILVMGAMDGIVFAVLWYVIGYKQWLVGREHGYVTLGEMLGDRFGSASLRGLIAVVSLVWLFPYVMLQQVGAGQALAGLTGGALPYWAGAALITVFMVAYVVLSGLRGVAWTDTLQGLFMLGIVWVAVGWVLTAAGGAGTIADSLASSNPEFLALGGGLYSPQWMIAQAVVIAFGVTMFPQVNQRFFVADSAETLKRSFALWPVAVLLLFVPAFLLGTWAAGLGVEVPAGSNVLPALLTEYTPVWFAALVVAGAMAAMMSSSDSMLLSGSSYLTRDLYRPFVAPGASDAREGWVARVGVAVFATLTFVASLFAAEGATELSFLVTLGDTAFGGYAQLTIPVLLALYWGGTTRTGIVAGVTAGQVAYLAHVLVSEVQFAGTTWLGATYHTWDYALWCMLLGLAVTVGVSRATAHSVGEDAAKFGVGAD
ncbi:sodium:solute symporter family protein [Candidatus Halobonum tyrrellensis]|uniref:Sodium/pantothenate symporter n=1 Tax=Candidatus Halobonum tyrrellensis G22 TaxID=1324957 RepID=V4HE51_9EURY|nr:sodium:solute symporter family protein [Candidatus Halobonum tyrrellensis]ESP88950.1 sodium/pantothenate symporter [Candidatus Halobonum tyrrellensis G22]